jgi:hypothetical protein
MNEVNQAYHPNEQRYVAVLFDEMKVKEGLVYNKYSGEIVGFVNLGGINDELLHIEKDDQPVVAKQMLVLMVCGILFKLDFPYAHFSTCGITADLLYPIIWEAVRRLEANGLQVMCITADGASCNRKFFRMHYDIKDPATYFHKAHNPYSADDRWIYFISDPSHLMNTVRNCWYHSGIHGTRHMEVYYSLYYDVIL